MLRLIKSGDDETAQLATLLALVETFVFSAAYREPSGCPTLHCLTVPETDEEGNRLKTGNDHSYRETGLVHCFQVFALEAFLSGDQ